MIRVAKSRVAVLVFCLGGLGFVGSGLAVLMPRFAGAQSTSSTLTSTTVTSVVPQSGEALNLMEGCRVIGCRICRCQFRVAQG